MKGLPGLMLEHYITALSSLVVRHPVLISAKRASRTKRMNGAILSGRRAAGVDAADGPGGGAFYSLLSTISEFSQKHVTSGEYNRWLVSYGFTGSTQQVIL